MRFSHIIVLSAVALQLAGRPAPALALPQDAARPGESAESEIIELEARRCAAINNLDVAEMNDVLADDYVHVHAVGIVNNKAQFIAGIQERPRRVERGPLTIKIYGNTAIISGEQRNIAPKQTLAAPAAAASAARGSNDDKFFVTQVAHREHGKWRFVSMHVTRLSDEAGPETPPAHR